MNSEVLPTAEFASLLYGLDGVALDDPAECFHEASRLYPEVAPGRLPALIELVRNPVLQQTIARASRTRDHLPGIDLPEARVGRARLGDVLRARRSRVPVAGARLRLEDLAAMLAAAYRSTNGRRSVPSGGALYPLELYAAAVRVDQLEPAVYHYNPFRHRLARLRLAVAADVTATLVDSELGPGAAALLVITAVFWRSRFKYGQRGYRFALLEAGHVAQNVLLASAALALDALPLGGFYDAKLDALVGADGLEESSVYAVLIGGQA